MAKIYIESEEWYPVCEIVEKPDAQDGDPELIIIDDEKLARWKRVFDEFDAVQDEMEDEWQNQVARKAKPANA